MSDYKLVPVELTAETVDLIKRLRIKAGMIELGELIAWGSDSALMREAADVLEAVAPSVQDSTPCRCVQCKTCDGNGIVVDWDQYKNPDAAGDKGVTPCLDCDGVGRVSAVPVVQGEPVVGQSTISDEIPARTSFGGTQKFTTAEQQECGCCGQSVMCDDDCDAVVIGGNKPELLTVDVLVGALEQVIKAAPSRGPLWHGSEQIVKARAALSAYHKQQEVSDVM